MRWLKRGLWLLAWSAWGWLGVGLHHQLPRKLDAHYTHQNDRMVSERFAKLPSLVHRGPKRTIRVRQSAIYDEEQGVNDGTEQTS